ncbi:MAG: DUF1598 domain-containing protein, partial [Planctomycetales bacterium]
MTSYALCKRVRRAVAGVGVALALCLVSVVFAGPLHQFNNNVGVNNVGGVAIDAEGGIVDLQREVRADVKENRDRLAAEGVPEGFDGGLELRKVSLQQLQEAIMQVRLAAGPRSLPPEIRYLAGIQRIKYIFIYPEDNDIVLAGPGEAWKIDDLGEAVGVTTGKPVVRLENLLVAMRNAFDEDPQVISCSIDPTQEGTKRFYTFLKSFGRLKNAREVTERKDEIEEKLGPQTVTVSGIKDTSRFAWTLVAADYRMKKFAMGLEKSPIKGMPSFLKLMGSKTNLKNMMPRWWMEDSYDAILTDPEGLSWELRGQGVKVLTEDQLIGEDGSRERTGKVNPAAQRWADNMTQKFDELCSADPVFGQLRNCMDLSVLAALIRTDGLHEKAGLDLEV